MAHQWRPRPIQGNICPTCSISHFPFCPPSAPINLNPNSTPQMHLQRPIYPNPDPYSSSGYWNPNPNPSLERENYGTQYQLHQLNYDYGAANGHVGESEFGVNDRSSKRLRVDGYSDSSRVLSDVDERRLKLVRDHGRTMDGQGPSSGFGFTGGMRGHDHENVVVDGNVGAGMRGYDRENAVVDGNIGVEMRPPSNLETNSFRDHQHPGYGKLSNPLNPGAFHHGWDYKQTTYGASEVSRDSFGTNPAFPGHSTPYYEQRSNTQQSDWTKYDYYDPSYQKGVRHRSEVRATLAPGGYPGPTYGQNFPRQRQFGHPDVNRPEGYGNLENMGQLNVSQGFDIRPPLPPSPPPPFPSDPSGHWSAPPKQLSSLFPVSVSSSAASHSSYNDYCPVPEPRPLHNSQIVHSSSNMFAGESPATKMASRHHYGEGQPFPSKNYISDKPKIVDASHLFKPPHRASRPDHFVIILRGLPGSGKSYIAKMLRDLEVEHGGDAPRIHSMDDYFMTEVEKVEENESSKSSVRGKKPTAKKVLLYCYEPEMEEAYRSSMLKSFKKTLEEGVYTFVIVDDRNLRIADFAQFWATAKRSGYEVYLLEAPYKDPAGCTARNVHGFTQGDVEKMARQWEDAPSLYLQLDVKSLFHGDDLKESSILEVDMDMEDGDSDGGLSKLEEANHETVVSPSAEGTGHDNSLKDEKRWDEETEEVKDLGHSKWSGDLDEDDRGKPERVRGSADVLSRLFTTYGKEGKSVHWGDQVSNTGFSIGAVKKANFASLLIGPGAGYNLKSNPLSEEETGGSAQKPSETKRHSVFQEQLRAERESFRAVFDRRRHRIGLDNADEE